MKNFLTQTFCSDHYWLYFSFLYATVLTLSFYPGILYSDSVARWLLAIDLTNNGLKILPNYNNHYPVIPSFLMSIFYSLTKEIGFFILLQAFCFSALFFRATYLFSKGIVSNLIISFCLLLPVNRIYAIFHSFDSLFGVIFLAFIITLLRFRSKETKYYSLCFFLFLLVATRLNAIFLLVPLMGVFFITYRKKEMNKNDLYISTVLCLIVTIAPFWVTSKMELRPFNVWVSGLAYEYENLAINASNPKHREYLAKQDISLKSSIEATYHGATGNPYYLHFKIRENNEKSKELLWNYLQLASEEPVYFLSEKSKFIASLLGISRPLENFEIGKWRGESGSRLWMPKFKKYFGFYTSEHKEKIIDNYLSFCNHYKFIFQPYLLILITLIIILVTAKMFGKNIALSLMMIFFFSLTYYLSFLIDSPNHEFRYFFPTFLLLELIAVVFLILFINKLILKMITWKGQMSS